MRGIYREDVSLQREMEARREEARQSHTEDSQYFFNQTSTSARGSTDARSNTQFVPDGGGHPDQVGNLPSSGQVGNPSTRPIQFY